MSGRNYPADTQRQKFLEESYNKERDTRIGWHMKLSSNDGEAPGAGKSKQYQVFRKKIEGQHSKPPIGKLPPIDSKQFHKKSADFGALPPRESDNSGAMCVEMRPVARSAKSLLYRGFSKEGTGRYQYLQNRYLIIPEEKFEYPILSSWEYGWRLGDVIKKYDIKKPTHGRTRIVADTFYTRTGVSTLQHA